MGFFDRFKKYIVSDGEKVKDPVCGMSIAPQENLRLDFGDKSYYFCSSVCREKFEKNPEKFVNNF